MSSKNKELAVLRFLSGPAAGKDFTIGKESLTLGRSEDADLVIADNLLSRQHIRLFYKEGKWFLEDLKSSNGTWLGGREVRGIQEVENHQSIRAGNSFFELVFSSVQEEFDPFLSYSFSPESIKEGTDSLPIEDIRWEHRRLSVMYNIQSQLSLLLDEQDIYRCICMALMSEISADYIYMMLLDSKKDQFTPCFGQNSSGEPISLSYNPVSSSVLNYVKKTRESILSVDPPNDIRFVLDSVTILRTQRVICVPLIAQQNLLGVIYMAAVHEKKNFTEEDLRLLAGVAHSSSLAIMNCRLLRKNIANERLAALGTTAASLSHYIKNILTGVDGCLYLLRMGIDEGDPGLMDEAWGILSRNHKRLGGLVMDLLNLAKDNDLNLRVQNVSETIIEAIELVRPNFDGMKIEISVDDHLLKNSLMAEVDSRAVHRVLLNLLNNSCDAVHERHREKPGGNVNILASITDNGRILEIHIEDNGCGIPKEKIDEVFDMFYSGKGENGTGLGLAVSKRLVEAHKGVISVSSEVNLYTIFSIRLPVSHKRYGTQLFERPV